MKRITLQRIVLTNWRGLNLDVKFNEDVTKISGDNELGKSSIMKAWFWLLTGYPSANEVKNFNLFNDKLGAGVTPETPKACVRAEVLVDGYEYILEKQATAKFTRKRGSNEYEKASSDTYECFIDNIATPAKDWDAWIEQNICPVDMLPYALNGNFFTELVTDDKNKARKILERLVGGIDDSDMKGDYSLLSEDLLKWSVDNIEERTKKEKSPVEDRQKEIPALIEAKEKTLAEYMQIDYDAILAEIEGKKKEIADIDNRILGNGEAIKPILGQRDAIFDIINSKTLKLNECRNTYIVRENANLAALTAKLSEIKTANAKVDKTNADNAVKKKGLFDAIAKFETEITRLEERRQSLLNEKDEIKARVFAGDKCAYCGQELPEDMLEKAREKFNAGKKADLENVVRKGKLNNDDIERVKEKLSEAKDALASVPEDSVKVDTATLEAEIASARANIKPYEETEEYAKLTKEIEDLKAGLPEIPQNDNQALTDMKQVIMADLDALNRRYGLKAKADEIRKDIDDLRNELREVGEKIAFLEGKIAKCKEYRQERADITSERINGKLYECRIDMWSAQKDGTMVPDTVLRGKDNVQFRSLNFSHQIKATIEMQELFMKSFDVALPVFVDEYSVFSKGNRPNIPDYQQVQITASDSPYLIVE